MLYFGTKNYSGSITRLYRLLLTLTLNNLYLDRIEVKNHKNLHYSDNIITFRWTTFKFTINIPSDKTIPYMVVCMTSNGLDFDKEKR